MSIENPRAVGQVGKKQVSVVIGAPAACVSALNVYTHHEPASVEAT